MSNIDIEKINSIYGSVIGDNAQVHNYYQEQLFDEIDSQELEERFRDSPKPEDNILENFKAERLFVLGGDLGIDKNEFALHLAFSLAEENSVSIKQWRRNANPQLKDLEMELQKSQSTAIFVVNDVQQKDVLGGSWFNQIYKTAKPKNNYILVSTDISFTSWHLEENARKFFPDLQETNLYNQETLVRFLDKLLEKIVEEQKDYPYIANIFDNSLSADPDYKLRELIVADLKTPRNISRFIELFLDAIKELEKEKEGKQEQLEESKEGKQEQPQQKSVKISDLIKTAKDDDKFITKMYNEILNSRERLLALGVSLFNGLFEDQLFAAIERVVQEVWQRRDSSLLAIDYEDLEKLQDNYFSLSENDFNEPVARNFKVVRAKKDYKVDIRSLKILSPNNRKKLFEIAWKSHRRQIITALNVLVDLVKESVAAEDYYRQGKWELYGDRTRSTQLRKTIADTLSEISLVSTSALTVVQGSLRELAIDTDWRVRDVAARAIARWRNEDEQTLLRTLQSFYSITLYKEANAEKKVTHGLYKQGYYLEKKPEKPGEQPDDDKLPDYIGATVAVAVGYSIVNGCDLDRDSLLDDFYNWLEELSQSRFRLVHLSFGYHTLYWVVPLHLKQGRMREMLKEITKTYRESLFPMYLKQEQILEMLLEIMQTYREWLFPIYDLSLNHAIARSLAHAYDYPDNWDEVKQVLDSWYNECDHHRFHRINSITESEYDALLKTVALTYGLIEYNQQAPLTVKDGFRRLEQIITKEKHPAVRQAVLFSSCILVSRYFEIVNPQLQDCLSHFTRNEYKQIVAALTEVYREQRANLEFKAGDIDKTIRFQGRDYQVWKNPLKRPLTSIERIMNSWAKLEKKPVAQQTALRVLVSFSSALGKEVPYQ